MLDHLLAGALRDFYARAWWRPELRDYLSKYRIELGTILPFVGAVGILDTVEYPADRFDFVGSGDRIISLVFEALNADEQPYDLIALPIGQPERPMTLLGRVGFLNLSLAMWPGTFSMGKALTVHRHARDWLAGGCRGTAIIRTDVAARQMLDLPGQLMAADAVHARDLRRIAESVVDAGKIVARSRRAA